jgi:superkiller protein 3
MKLIPSKALDRAIFFLAIFVVVAGIGFGAFYYIDRYYYPNDTLVDRQTSQLEEMIRRDPGNPDLRVQVALHYLTKGWYEKAEEQSREALKINENHEGALVTLGSIMIESGQYQEAIEPFAKVVELNADSPTRLENRRLEAAYYYLGMAYLNVDIPEEAVESLKEALLIDHTDADAHYLLGRAYQAQKDYEGAIASYGEALRFVPDYEEAYQGLTESYEAIGDNTMVLYGRGMVNFTQGNYEVAIDLLKQVVEAKPELAEGFFGLGISYEKSGMVQEAIDAYEQALAINPDYFAAQQRHQGLTAVESKD